MFFRSLCVGVSAALLIFASSSFAKSKTYNLEYDHVPNQLIVKFKDGVKSLGLKGVGAKSIHEFTSNGAQLIETDGKSDLLELAKRLSSRSDVEFVEANTIITIDATFPNDSDFSKLYGMHNDGGTGGTEDADIDAPEAWDVTTGSRDVVIGIIDTGVDYSHVDIAPNYWNNPGEVGTDAEGNDKTTNGIDDDGNGFIDDFRGWDFANDDNDPMDDNKHGTHCAGTIGAAGNDGVGVVGVNWEVSMVGIKFLTGSGSGSLDNAVKSIEYATTLGLTLSSNSWGGGGFSETMKAAIAAAQDAGILFIAAAGNSSANNDSNPHYPSSYDLDNVIAVAATDHKDEMASFSCYGLTSVDLAAPGVDIFSTVIGGEYSSLSGTSMATPHVSGAAALIKAAYPDATATQIKDRLMNGVDVVSSMSGKVVTGGRMNIANSLENDSIPPNAARNIVVSDATTTSVVMEWDAAGDDGSVGTAKRYDVRISDQPILTETQWQSATKISAAYDFSVAGKVSTTISGLPMNASGYVAIKATDNVGNMGPLSESVAFEVEQVTLIGGNDAETLEGVTVEGTWGLQEVTARGGNAFSDSPEGPYAEDSNISLTLPAIELASPNVALVFNTMYDLEKGYDFGYVEISTDDGVTWLEAAKLTGSSAWTQTVIDLGAVITEQVSSSLLIRFRLTSDYSVQKDGWLVDDIAVFGAQN